VDAKLFLLFVHLSMIVGLFIICFILLVLAAKEIVPILFIAIIRLFIAIILLFINLYRLINGTYFKHKRENAKLYEEFTSGTTSPKNTHETTLNKCHVYLMHDESNNYHKIGISKNPIYREKTLLGDKPTIELIISKEYPSRKIAMSFEKALHETYSNKRVRGEWFELSDLEVLQLKEALS